jgi:site-specific recombinase XerD
MSNRTSQTIGALSVDSQRFTQMRPRQRSAGTISILAELERMEFRNSQDLPNSISNALRPRSSALFGHAIRQDYCATNPAQKIDKPKSENRAPEILTTEQARQLMATTRERDAGLIPYVSVCLFAGIRPELEAGKLEWPDISKNYIEIRAKIAKSRKRRLVDIGRT